MSRRTPPPPPAPAAPFNAAFERLRARLPAGELRDGPAAPAPAPAAPPARAVVRLERKGRGGKEATVIEHLALSASELASWLLELKRTLGCGGAIEGDALVLQGDQRDRAVAWLERRGVRRVTRG